ncbi:MAG: hypothetical protein WDW36_006808 [Sanguina aurantia]
MAAGVGAGENHSALVFSRLLTARLLDDLYLTCELDCHVDNVRAMVDCLTQSCHDFLQLEDQFRQFVEVKRQNLAWEVRPHRRTTLNRSPRPGSAFAASPSPTAPWQHQHHQQQHNPSNDTHLPNQQPGFPSQDEDSQPSQGMCSPHQAQQHQHTCPELSLPQPSDLAPPQPPHLRTPQHGTQSAAHLSHITEGGYQSGTTPLPAAHSSGSQQPSQHHRHQQHHDHPHQPHPPHPQRPAHISPSPTRVPNAASASTHAPTPTAPSMPSTASPAGDATACDSPTSQAVLTLRFSNESSGSAGNGRNRFRDGRPLPTLTCTPSGSSRSNSPHSTTSPHSCSQTTPGPLPSRPAHATHRNACTGTSPPAGWSGNARPGRPVWETAEGVHGLDHSHRHQEFGYGDQQHHAYHPQPSVVVSQQLQQQHAQNQVGQQQQQQQHAQNQVGQQQLQHAPDQVGQQQQQQQQQAQYSHQYQAPPHQQQQFQQGHHAGWHSHLNWSLVFTPSQPAIAEEVYPKLISPGRRKSPLETARRTEARHARAERARALMGEERRAKVAKATRGREGVRNVQEGRVEQLSAKWVDRIARGTELRQAHLAERVQKAGDEGRKVAEVAFINALNEQDRKLALQEKQDEGEARRRLALVEIQSRQLASAAASEGAQERRKALEDARREGLEERARRKQSAQDKMEDGRRCVLAMREAARGAARIAAEVSAVARQQETALLSSRIEERLAEADARRLLHLETIKERAALGKDFERRIELLGASSVSPRPNVSTSTAPTHPFTRNNNSLTDSAAAGATPQSRFQTRSSPQATADARCPQPPAGSDAAADTATTRVMSGAAPPAQASGMRASGPAAVAGSAEEAPHGGAGSRPRGQDPGSSMATSTGSSSSSSSRTAAAAAAAGSSVTASDLASDDTTPAVLSASAASSIVSHSQAVGVVGQHHQQQQASVSVRPTSSSLPAAMTAMLQGHPTPGSGSLAISCSTKENLHAAQQHSRQELPLPLALPPAFNDSAQAASITSSSSRPNYSTSAGAGAPAAGCSAGPDHSSHDSGVPALPHAARKLSAAALPWVMPVRGSAPMSSTAPTHPTHSAHHAHPARLIQSSSLPPARKATTPPSSRPSDRNGTQRPASPPLPSARPSDAVTALVGTLDAATAAAAAAAGQPGPWPHCGGAVGAPLIQCGDRSATSATNLKNRLKGMRRRAAAVMARMEAARSEYQEDPWGESLLCSSQGVSLTGCWLQQVASISFLEDGSEERAQAVGELTGRVRLGLEENEAVAAAASRPSGLLALLLSEVAGFPQPTPDPSEAATASCQLLGTLLQLCPANCDWLLASNAVPGLVRCVMRALDRCNGGPTGSLDPGGLEFRHVTALLRVLTVLAAHRPSPANAQLGVMHELAMAFVVAAGIIHRCRDMFSLYDCLQAPSQQPIPEHITQALLMLEALTASHVPPLPLLSPAKRWLPAAGNTPGMSLAFQETAMCGLPALLTSLLLHAAPSCAPAEALPQALPANFLQAANSVMTALNNVARLDLLATQSSLGASRLRVEFFHLISFLLSYATNQWGGPTTQGVLAAALGGVGPSRRGTSTHTSTHTGTHTSTHTGTDHGTLTGIHTGTHTGTHTSIHTDTNSGSHTGTHTSTHTGTHTSTHTGTHTGTDHGTLTGTDHGTLTGTDHGTGGHGSSGGGQGGGSHRTSSSGAGPGTGHSGCSDTGGVTGASAAAASSPALGRADGEPRCRSSDPGSDEVIAYVLPLMAAHEASGWAGGLSSGSAGKKQETGDGMPAAQGQGAAVHGLLQGQLGGSCDDLMSLDSELDASPPMPPAAPHPARDGSVTPPSQASTSGGGGSGSRGAAGPDQMYGGGDSAASSDHGGGGGGRVTPAAADTQGVGGDNQASTACEPPLVRLLNEVLLLIGHFALLCPANQDVLQWGANSSSGSVLQRLTGVPFAYFCTPQLVQVLVPTLLAVCFKDARACATISCQVSPDFVNRYLRELDLHSAGLADPADLLAPALPALAARYRLRERFPLALLPDASLPIPPLRTRSLAFSPSTLQHSPYVPSHPSPSPSHQPTPTHPPSPMHSHGNYTPTRHSQLPSQFFPETTHFGDSSTVRNRQSPGPAHSLHTAAGEVPGQGQAGARPSVRSVFMQATGPSLALAHTAAYSLPPDAGSFRRSSPARQLTGSSDGGGGGAGATAAAATGQVPGADGNWTSKYLRNDGLRACVNTLLALAYLPPHASLHGGKTHVSIAVACDHVRPGVHGGGHASTSAGHGPAGPATAGGSGGGGGSTGSGFPTGRYASGVGGGSHVPGASSEEQLRRKHQVVRVKGAGGGWSFEFGIGPNSDQGLFDQYQIAGERQPPHQAYDADLTSKLELKDSEKLPPWARNEKERELAMNAAKSDFPIPFGLSLLLSAFVAIAAVGAVFVWVDKDPIFGVLYPDNFLWAPILGFLAFTGLPSAGFLFYKGVTGFNEASDLQDKLDGYN